MTIKILHQQGHSQRAIAKQLGISRNTVKKHLQRNDDQPQYAARPVISQKLDPYKDYLKERVASAAPVHLSAVVLMREIKAQGYGGGITRLRQFLAELRGANKAETIIRFETDPGKQMQMDLGANAGWENTLTCLCRRPGIQQGVVCPYH